jgi:PAS domain S-box-containing protein
MDKKTLWQTLWDFDPNGLVVVDRSMTIQVVNDAFCRMFGVESARVIGQPVSSILDDLSPLEQAREKGTSLTGFEREYPGRGLFLRSVVFPIIEEDLVACILVDLTHEHQRELELRQVQEEMLARVNKVINRQMQIAQEIASLLGESTAEAKVNLIKIRDLLKEELH